MSNSQTTKQYVVIGVVSGVPRLVYGPYDTGNDAYTARTELIRDYASKPGLIWYVRPVSFNGGLL